MIDTKTELMVRAEDLVRGRGYSGFSYADLSEAVGIRKASIHHHFPTKELLVATVLRNYTERYATALVRIETHYKDALDRFDAYGRLYLTGDMGMAMIVDISLLPEARGTGLGTAILKDLLAGETRPVQLHVEKHNPARRLYERFGFKRVEEGPIYDRMISPPRGRK